VVHFHPDQRRREGARARHLARDSRPDRALGRAAAPAGADQFPGNEWFPRLDRDGWLYFGSDRPGGLGRTDIWRARAGRDGRWAVENLGPAINSAGDEYEALPSPDGRWLLLSADGYYRSDRVRGGWSKRVRLGSEINANGSEIGAAFSPSGRSWLFARALDDRRSGELLLVGGKEKWPKPCPARPR